MFGGMAWQEWWTYRPSDFLMFSPRVYWQLFAQVNQAWWPVALVLITCLLAAQRLVQRDSQWTSWLLVASLSAAWCSAAVLFHHLHFAPVNSAAQLYAAGFVVQAALLLLWCRGGRWHWRGTPLGLLAFALLLHPALAALSGRAWQQAELFALAPDPTAYATLAALCAWRSAGTPAGIRLWRRRLLFVWPVCWCLVSAATLAVMGSAQAWVPVLVLAAATWGNRSAARVAR